jgi:hypothetical protein
VERAKERLPWARDEAERWRQRFRHEGYRRTAEELEAEVRELERIAGEIAA